jgi:hypothetical protein
MELVKTSGEGDSMLNVEFLEQYMPESLDLSIVLR